jgi:hypothetical protein
MKQLSDPKFFRETGREMLTKDLQRITVIYSDITLHDILLYSVAILIKGY